VTDGWVTEVTLTADQRREIIGTLNQFERSPELRQKETQVAILQRIESALTAMGGARPCAQNAHSRCDAVKRKLEHAVSAFQDLKEIERDLFDLLAPHFADDLARLVHAADKVADSLQLGQGEKYGTDKEQQSRFLADQLADLWRMHLGLEPGFTEKASFYRLLVTVFGQCHLPVLGRDALRAVLVGAGKG